MGIKTTKSNILGIKGDSSRGSFPISSFIFVFLVILTAGASQFQILEVWGTIVGDFERESVVATCITFFIVILVCDADFYPADLTASSVPSGIDQPSTAVRGKCV